MRLRERLRAALGVPLLVVTAVDAERDAVHRGLTLAEGGPHRVVVEAVGVGPAAAAAGTARLLALAEADSNPYAAVVSAGIAGGFGIPAGTIVLGERSIAADFGSDSPQGFASASAVGYGVSTMDADADLLAALRGALPAAVVGEVLTVSTVTGTAARAAELVARHPLARAEAMEGFGVATAAYQAGVAFAEVRTVSNPVGPRDRDAWRIDEALAALVVVGSCLEAVCHAAHAGATGG